MPKTSKKASAHSYDMLTLPNAVEEFNKLIDRIEADYPDVVREANNLAKQIVDPLTAPFGDCWRVLWNKPLYRWGKVENGDKWAAAVQRSCKSGSAWTVIADPRGLYNVQHVGKGRSKNDFRASGRTARELEVKGVPPERLYSIIGSASFLSKRSTLGGAPFADIACADAATIEELSAELGYGWSHITVLHLLTDMGLACKPDLHLNATCKYLGLAIDTNKPPTLEVALTIVDFVKELVRARWDVDRGYWLRYADKCLMEASRQNLFEKPAWWASHEQWLEVRAAGLTSPGTCLWSIDGETIGTAVRSKTPERLLKQFVKATKKRTVEIDSARSFVGRQQNTILRLREIRWEGRRVTFSVTP